MWPATSTFALLSFCATCVPNFVSLQLSKLLSKLLKRDTGRFADGFGWVCEVKKPPLDHPANSAAFLHLQLVKCVNTQIQQSNPEKKVEVVIHKTEQSTPFVCVRMQKMFVFYFFVIWPGIYLQDTEYELWFLSVASFSLFECVLFSHQCSCNRSVKEGEHQ